MTDLRELIFDGLDNAKENGYFNPGEMLHASSAKDIALDLLAFSDIGETIDSADDLIPHIEEWLKLNIPT